VSLAPMFYGYGATDAAELAKIKVEATSLVGLNPNFTSGKVIYHTHNDVVENLQPEAVQAGLEIALAFVEEREGKLLAKEGRTADGLEGTASPALSVQNLDAVPATPAERNPF